MRTDLVEPDDRRWADVLAAVAHDFYHRPDYADLWAREQDGRARAVIATDGARTVLMPVIIRDTPFGLLDATAPYGYPGPIVAPEPDSDFLGHALVAAGDRLAEEGCVSLFLRSHPLLAPDFPTGVGTVVEHAPTVVIDLAMADGEWMAGLRKSHRAQIRRALADGHRAYIDVTQRHYERFKELYRQTMERVGADAFYRFSDRYFDDLRSSLGDALHLCVVEHGGRIWAAGLFVETSKIFESHLSGDDGTHRRRGAKKLMYAHVRDWAKARGGTWLHLGGGGPAGNLLAFKQGFSRDLRPYRSLRVVLRPDEYARLVSRADPNADPADKAGYFPRYRGAQRDASVDYRDEHAES